MESGFWKKLKKPIMIVAPMSGVSDEPFRLTFLKYGKPSVFWTEFVSVDGLFSKGQKYCLKLLEYSPKERPIVAQIFGSNPDNFKKAAEIIVKLGFDGIDINMGCPDINIEKRGGGAALINNPKLAKEIIRATILGAESGRKKIPVSVKTRIGYKKNEVESWIPALLEEKIAVLTVHFRTKKEMYIPGAHWDLAKDILKLRDKYSPETLIIGNGDVKSLLEAKSLVKETGLDGVMIGRGVLGDPWFFSGKVPSIKKRLNAVVEHAKLFDKFHKEETKKKGYNKKFNSMKKHFHAYTKGFRGARDLRDKLMKVSNTAETKKVIEDFLK